MSAKRRAGYLVRACQLCGGQSQHWRSRWCAGIEGLPFAVWREGNNRTTIGVFYGHEQRDITTPLASMLTNWHVQGQPRIDGTENLRVDLKPPSPPDGIRDTRQAERHDTLPRQLLLWMAGRTKIFDQERPELRVCKGSRQDLCSSQYSVSRGGLGPDTLLRGNRRGVGRCDHRDAVSACRQYKPDRERE